MSDNRAHKRYNVDLLDITCAIIQTSNIEIIDISPKGISLQAPRRLNIGEEYNLKLRSNRKALSINGIVLWSKINGIHDGVNGDVIPVYIAGLEFIDVTKLLRDEINNFIESHKIENIAEEEAEWEECDIVQELRHYPRVPVNTPLDAFIIDQSQLLSVKDLSFGGIRLECKQAIKIHSSIPMMMNFSAEKFIVFKGKVTFCRLIKKIFPKMYTVGIAFSDMSMEDRKILTESIRLLRDIDTSPSQ